MLRNIVISAFLSVIVVSRHISWTDLQSLRTKKISKDGSSARVPPPHSGKRFFPPHLLLIPEQKTRRSRSRRA